jgi:8-hydroxy-5-deazaflavin:NADPH oxidoreductase
MARFGVLGTGAVGQAIASKLVSLGHAVTMGSREAGNKKAVDWANEAGERGSEGSFADAAAFGEILINATAGTATLEVLSQAGDDALAGKTLLDIANPLDFSGGFPPTLSVVNEDSLAEQIQRAYPAVRVVKTLNTVTADLMVDPSRVAGSHNVFVSGDDAGAKAVATDLLVSFGWPREDVIDLGDLTAARALEMYLPLWIRLMQTGGSPYFNIKVLRT